MVEKFAAKDPPCIAYDEKLQFYSNLANEVGSILTEFFRQSLFTHCFDISDAIMMFQVVNQPMSKDIDFVRLQLEPLAVTVQANARAWVKELGRLLKESAKQNLMSLKTEIEVC